MPKLGKHLLALLLLLGCVSSKCLAQNKAVDAKVMVAPKEVIAPKTVVVPKIIAVPKSVIAPKTVVTPKIAVDPKATAESKKTADIQIAALKDGISTMPTIPGNPVMADIVVDSMALLKNLKVKPFKVNSHASYYHDKLNGKRTASGKPFDNKKFTAAHRTFAFGTKLLLTNTLNNKSVVVEVNDRGPFTKSREIDISKAAFMEIATNKNSGSVNITIEVIQ